MTNRYPSRINWENEPSIQTPINETNLNRMDNALFNMAADVVSLDNETFKSVSYDSSNGKFTFVKGNGQTYVLDTALEKIATNFRYDSTTQSLILTLADGTTQSIDLSDMITNVDLEDSTTISWTITSGKAKANIINGSITSDKLQPNYLSDITNQANKATTASTNAAKDKLVAEGYANGKQNGVPVDSTSPYYHNNAEYFKDQAQAVSHVEIATTTTPGIVKPDGTTITVEADGTIHGANTYTLPTASASTLGGIKVGTNLTIDADGTLNATGGSSITGYGKSLEYDEDSSELSLKDESGNVLSTVTVEGGESYTLPTASTTTLGGVKVDGSSITINDGVISASGGSSVGTSANMLKPTLASTTLNGVTVTSNGDGTYTLNGTASADAEFELDDRTSLINLFKNNEGKTLRFCGCPSGGGEDNYKLRIWAGTGGIIMGYDYGDGFTFTIPSIISSGTIGIIKIIITSGVTINNLVFKPMLTTDLSATYDDYTPYTGSTGKLNSDVAELRGAVGDAWNSSSTYTTGQYVIYQNALYKAKASVSAGTLPTNTTYWDKTNVTTELASSGGSSIEVPKHYILNSSADTITSNTLIGIDDVISYSKYTNTEYILLELPARQTNIFSEIRGGAVDGIYGIAQMGFYAWTAFYLSANAELKSILENNVHVYVNSSSTIGYVYLPIKYCRYDLKICGASSGAIASTNTARLNCVGIRTALPTNLTEVTVGYKFY